MPKQEVLKFTKESGPVWQKGISESLVTPDIFIQKFDNSVHKFWKSSFLKKPNFTIVKDINDRIIEETMLDDKEFSLLKSNRFFMLSRIYNIPDSTNPILPIMIKEIANSKAELTQISYVHNHSEVFQTRFDSEANLALDREYYVDLMRNAPWRGFKLYPLEQLRLSMDPSRLVRTINVLTYSRVYKIFEKIKYGSGFKKIDRFEIGFSASFLKKASAFTNPLYQIRIDVRTQSDDKSIDSAILSERLNKIAVMENLSLEKAEKSDFILKSLQL